MPIVLIDTWWNVNRIEDIKIHVGAHVLIDTWWNVNIYNYDSNIRRTNVLIDTWWNVNRIEDIKIHVGAHVLIDTWWNVNLKRGYITQQELEF